MGNLSEIKPAKRVKLNIGGKVHTLSYDMNAYALLEEKYGSVEAAMDALGKVGSLKATIFMLWAGLAHEYAILDSYGEVTGYRLTQREVGSWLDISSIQAISEKINEAMGVALPDIEGNEEAMNRLRENGYEIRNGAVVKIEAAVSPDGHAIAKVVETEEEKTARLVEEEKNVSNAL